MDNLAVPPGVIVALRKANIHSIPAIMEYSNGDLMRKTGLNETQVRGLVEIASESVLSRFERLTAFDMYHTVPAHKLTSGCPLIDVHLQGGFLPRVLTEIAGTSGAGKSQLCLQLSLTVQLPLRVGGFGGRSVYISTECAIPSGRLKQLATVLSLKHTQMKVKELMDGVLVHHCATVQNLRSLLNNELQLLLKLNSDIKLLIIDSLAALFRVEYNKDESNNRTNDLKSIGATLHNLINQYGLTVICTNQMTADFSTNSAQPALGLMWSHMINMRLVLTRDESVDNMAGFCPFGNPVPRIMKTSLAPHIPDKSINYYIDDEGLHGLEDINCEMLD